MSILSVSNLDYKSYVWASRPSSARPNEIIKVTDIGPVDELFFYTGSRWAPLNGTVVLASTNTSVSVTGTVDETELATFTLPGGLVSANGVIEISSFWAVTNSANNKILKIKIGLTSDTASGGSSIVNRTETTILYHQHFCALRSANATNSQKAVSSSLATGFGSTTGTIFTNTYDLTTDKKIFCTGQLANTGETITLRGYRAIYRE